MMPAPPSPLKPGSAPSVRQKLSWNAIEQAVEALVVPLTTGRPPWQGIVAVARGGLAPAALLACRLGIRRVETVCVASYDRQRQEAARILKPAAASVVGEGAGWLVVDDLVDTGQTLALLRRLLPQAGFAVLYAKPAGQGQVDFWASLAPQHTWLVFPWEIGPETDRP